MKKLLLVSLIVLGAALAFTCSPYDPSLGDAPFRCGTAAPFCPDGYQCVKEAGRDLCFSSARILAMEEDSGPVGPGVDSGPVFTCSDDTQLEPNDTLADPTQTPIPTDTDRFSLQGLSICPKGDADVFAFAVDKEHQTVRVDIRYRADRGLLLLDLLDQTGASIRSGTPVEGSSDWLRAELPEVTPGAYFVQVRASAPDAINNYGLDIAVLGQ